MLKSTFIFCCCILLASNQSLALNWCSSYALEYVLECLTGKYFQDMEPLQRRIECSKIGLCKPKPWDIFNSEIKIVRKYADCMKINIVGVLKISLDIESKCRNYLNENLPNYLRHMYNLHLLPDLHKNYQNVL